LGAQHQPLVLLQVVVGCLVNSSSSSISSSVVFKMMAA
jgi:hypothetical protein